MFFDDNNVVRLFGEALTTVTYNERLSREASMEELCKILLVKLCYERKNWQVMTPSAINEGRTGKTVSSIYGDLFQAYVPSFLFPGWDKTEVKLKTFEEVLNILQPLDLAKDDNIETGKNFTAFMQMHYDWYANDYSTPMVLTDYIFRVLDVNRFKSILDPCCGIGGMLATANREKRDFLHLSGNDISQTMTNITRLHLKMYGYEGDDFTSFDYTDDNFSGRNKLYDCIVAQIPTRHQTFSIAGKRDGGYGEDFFDFDLTFISHILSQLTEEGIAAIIVPKSVMEDRSKDIVRDRIARDAELLNISKLENVVVQGNFHKLSYYILFARKTEKHQNWHCTATLAGNDKDSLERAAKMTRQYVTECKDIEENELCKWFEYRSRTNWNISLLFIRDKIGKEYEAVRLEDILEKRRVKVEPEPDRKYQMLRVKRRGKGVYVKEEIMGESIYYPIYEARPDDLIVSAFDVDYGSIGYVQKDVDEGIVAKDFYLFEVDRNRVDMNYLRLVLTSEPVLEQLQVMNKRTYALSRVSMKNFLSVVIPLPDLQTQKVLAKGLQRYVDKVNKAEEELDDAKKDFNKKVFGKE